MGKIISTLQGFNLVLFIEIREADEAAYVCAQTLLVFSFGSNVL
jgi:hypothetical protein